MSQPRASLAKKPLHLLHTFVSWQLAQMCLRLGKSRSHSISRSRLVLWFIVGNLLDPMMDRISGNGVKLIQFGDGIFGLFADIERLDHFANAAVVPLETYYVFHGSRSSQIK